jgi:hypothetical protein
LLPATRFTTGDIGKLTTFGRPMSCVKSRYDDDSGGPMGNPVASASYR